MDEKSSQSDAEGNPDSNMNLLMTPSADDILGVSPVNSFDKTVPQSSTESRSNSFDKTVAQTTTESRFSGFDKNVAQMTTGPRAAPVNSFDKIVVQSAPVVQSTAERVAARRAARRKVRKPPMSPTPVTTSQQLSQDNTLSPSRFRTIVTEEPMTPSRRSTFSEEAFSSSSEDDDHSEINIRESIAASLASRHSSRLSQGDGLSQSVQSEFDKALMTGDGVPNVGSASFDIIKEADFLSQAENSVIQEAMSMDDSHEDSPSRSNSRARRLPRTQRPTSPASASFPPPPPPIRNSLSWAPRGSDGTGGAVINSLTSSSHPRPARQELPEEDLSAGVLPDVLMNMRQKIESLSLFDSDMMRLAQGDFHEDDLILQETRETLKRSSQQSISPAVLVSLAHKRYERRRLAAMEIEKVIRGLAHQGELERVRAILLLLSDDYVRSTSEDARKGGVVGLAASAIGLKKASDDDAEVMECRDLILASVVHACQDHSQRVRYYATESLFNVVKVIPSLAVAHFFVLFEILRSLYADVDPDVRSGAEFLDKKLKDVIVGAINSGSFTADACVPIFARFVYMRNKATKRLTLTWLQELNEKLIGSPVLEFLHLFLSGIFAMVADPNVSIRQSALAFLQSVLPKLLVDNAAFDDKGASMMKVDFDKILQSLVTTMEHPGKRSRLRIWNCPFLFSRCS
jgi:vacuole morphology and inheritance protein 14